MKTTDKISRIPVAALEQHIAIVGKTGSGKTFRAKGEVERLLRNRQRVCIIDPTGAWYGLKSSADGKSAGFPVVIFGGDHADVPINEHAGEALGKLIAETSTSSIIDLTGLGTNARHRFAERFFESLYQHNRDPLYLVTDEADEFAPQSGAPGTERMLGAFDRIVRRGRIKGFRVWMISQRPAVLNKNVLTQAGTLVAMRLPASQDRKAVELWIKGQADESQADAMMSSLASLPRGCGWTWAPEQGVLEKGVSPNISTFDSSRAPEIGTRVSAPRKIAAVDLTQIRQAMAEAIEEAQANDPRELRKKLSQAQAELRKALSATKAAPAKDSAETKALVASLRAEVKSLNTYVARLTKTINDINKITIATGLLSAPTKDVPRIYPRLVMGKSEPAPAVRRKTTTEQKALPAVELTGDEPTDELSGPEVRILNAIAFYETIGVTEPLRAAVAVVAGYTSCNHGAFKNPLGKLRSRKFLHYPTSETVELTAIGREHAVAEGPTSVEEFHRRLYDLLSGPEAKILRSLIEHGTEPMSREQNAQEAGYTSWTHGAYKNPLGHLRSMGLVSYPDANSVQAEPILFPEL